MTILTLEDGDLTVRIWTKGGVIVDKYYRGKPIFRPYPDARSDAVYPLKCASFPLVPFGNRVEWNMLDLDGHTYHLTPNIEWDTHYLHGDGWSSQWTVMGHAPQRAVLQFDYGDENYTYRATQEFYFESGTFLVALSVENTDVRPMPFGIGHHLFFPLTDLTTLHAPARAYWTEKHAFLPDQCCDIPSKYNYLAPAALPDEWINNGFEGWNAQAAIHWPENGIALEIQCSPEFDRYYLFRSSTDFEPNYKGDYFCFEPMSHSANGQNMKADHGLKILNHSEVLVGTCRLRPKPSLDEWTSRAPSPR